MNSYNKHDDDDANGGKEDEPETTEALLRAAGLAMSDASNLASLLQQLPAQQHQQQSSLSHLRDPVAQARALLTAHLGQQQQNSQSFGGANSLGSSSNPANQPASQQQQLTQAQAIQALLASQQQGLGAQSLESLNQVLFGGSSFVVAGSGDSSVNNSSSNYAGNTVTSQSQSSLGQQQESQSQAPNIALLQSLCNALTSGNSDPSLQQFSPMANAAAQLAGLLSGQSNSSSNGLDVALQNALLNTNQHNNTSLQQATTGGTMNSALNSAQAQNLLQSTLNSLGQTGSLQQLQQQQQRQQHQHPLQQQSGLSLSNLQELQAQLQAQLQSQLTPPFAQQNQQRISHQHQQETETTAFGSSSSFAAPKYTDPQHPSVISAPASFSATAASSSNTSSDQQPLDQETEDILASIPPMPAELEEMKKKKPRGRSSTFPRKLYQMLTELEEQEGGTDIASFLLPHGRSFRIHKPKEFTKDIMPKYFQMSTFSSFQRQLNLYDFQRITEGPERDAYYHELFVKGQPLLCTRIKRNKLKGQTRAKQEERFQSYEKHKGGK